MTQEYQPVGRERPEHLETKSTVDTVLGYTPAPVPVSSRTGTSLSDDERSDADVFPGTFAAGNGVQNSESESKASRERESDSREDDSREGSRSSSAEGISTASGGTQSKPALGSSKRTSKAE